MVELQQVYRLGMGFGGRAEGFLVGKPERILRYQSQHMLVCVKWVWKYQAGWHRRSFALVPARNVIVGDKSFFVCKNFAER